MITYHIFTSFFRFRKMNQNRNSGSQNNGSNNEGGNKDDNNLTNDAQNYKNTLRAYYKSMLQLPPQREWMKNKFGLRVR